MRRLIVIFAVISGLFVLTGVKVAEGVEEHEKLDMVMGEMLRKYEVSRLRDLDCGRMTQDDLERVGDSWMEVVHPGEVHERMDAMMGGEGSESLRLMHIRMGQSYLGCNFQGGRWFNMMGPGMMGGGQSGYGMMSGWFGPWGLLGSIGGFVIYLLVIVLIFVAIRYLWIRGNEIQRGRK